ncbi:MAG: site-specific tyrosine recombinase XerD [Lachnospiraceae bacterium]
MEQKIGAFIAYLRDERGASVNTQVSYQRDLKQLREYLFAQGITNIEDVNETSLNSYILYLEKEGKAPSTVSRGIASAKGFFDYCYKRRDIMTDPAENLRPPKVEKKFPRILTIRETECLMEQPDLQCSKGIRDKAMLELLYATGIRVSELVSLKMEDINLTLGYIVCHEKSKDRIIPFGEKAKKALTDYLVETRNQMLKEEECDFLFVSCLGKPMSRQGFWKLIKYYTVKAGIEKEITPQTLRHSFAAHLLQNGADIHSVQEMLGHADVSTTQVYVEMQTGNVRENYKKCHPRG